MLETKVLDKFSELVTYIKDSDDYKRYLKLKDKVYANKEIMNLINSIKKEQRSIMLSKGNKSDSEKLIKTNLELLNTYPVYVEFNYLQEDLNNSFRIIKERINDYFNNQLN